MFESVTALVVLNISLHRVWTTFGDTLRWWEGKGTSSFTFLSCSTSTNRRDRWSFVRQLVSSYNLRKKYGEFLLTIKEGAFTYSLENVNLPLYKWPGNDRVHWDKPVVDVNGMYPERWPCIRIRLPRCAIKSLDSYTPAVWLGLDARSPVPLCSSEQLCTLFDGDMLYRPDFSTQFKPLWLKSFRLNHFLAHNHFEARQALHWAPRPSVSRIGHLKGRKEDIYLALQPAKDGHCANF